MHRNDLHSGEDLLVDDEGHRGDVEDGQRRDGEPHQPLPAFRPLPNDPAPPGGSLSTISGMLIAMAW
jgi:hypothetical protein